MKLLLTSSGITNDSLRRALVELLGKPIAESSALFIPTAIYPFSGGAFAPVNAIRGLTRNKLCELGWKSLGLLELSVLPSIDREVWVPAVRAADALLVYGGDPLFLCHWLRQSGLAELLQSLPELVYVGNSAGSIAASATFAETYSQPSRGRGEPLASEPIVFVTPKGEIRRTLVTGRGLGLVDFTVIPHFAHEEHPDASLANAATWAARMPGPTYAIDDETGIKVVDGAVEVVSEGQWKIFGGRS